MLLSYSTRYFYKGLTKFTQSEVQSRDNFNPFMNMNNETNINNESLEDICSFSSCFPKMENFIAGSCVLGAPFWYCRLTEVSILPEQCLS